MRDALGFSADLEWQVGYQTLSNALVHGYPYVSDAARLTYVLVSSLVFNQQDPTRRAVWYSRGRLAQIRGVHPRALRWHLAELTHFGLLSGEERPGQPTLYRLQRPSRIELERTLFVRGYITSGRDVEWPPDLEVAFYEWIVGHFPELVDELGDAVERGIEWRQMRQRRQGKGKRSGS